MRALIGYGPERNVLPDDMRVFCGHEYTESNLRFAAHVEPDNEDVKRKLEWAEGLRAKAAADWHDAGPDEMTIPSTIGDEKKTNPFMRVPDAAELRRADVNDGVHTVAAACVRRARIVREAGVGQNIREGADRRHREREPGVDRGRERGEGGAVVRRAHRVVGTVGVLEQRVRACGVHAVDG